MRKQIWKKTAFAVCAATLLMNMASCSGQEKHETEVSASIESESTAGEEAGTETESTVSDETGEENGSAEEGSTNQEEAAVKGSLAYVRQAVKSAYGESYLPSMPIDAQLLESMYGIAPELYEEFIGEVPMISAQVDSFIAVRGKEGKGEEIQEILENYRDSQLENSLMYPMNLPVVTAAKVVREGDDVFLVMTGTSEGYGQAETEDEMLEMAEKQIEIGVKAVESCYEN